MLFFILLVLGHIVITATLAFADTFPGGFTETQATNTRTKYSEAEIAAIIPGSRSAFTFPEPYETAAVQLTEAGDCGGQDCLFYVGYSYLSNMNNHVGESTIKIFLNFSTAFGGDGPNLLTYNKSTGGIAKDGPIFSVGSAWRSTGDGSTTWYWSGTLPNRIYMIDVVGASRKILRLNTDSIPVAAPQETVFDLAGNFSGCTVGSCPYNLWQIRSSQDDTVHSMTVRDSGNVKLGCLVYQPNRSPTTRWYPKVVGGTMDECSVDASGRWTLINEFTPTRINRFYDNWNNTENRVTVFANTLGHYAPGYGYFIGLGDPEGLPGSVFYYTMSPFAKGAVQHSDENWDLVMMNHPSHFNSVNGGAYAGQMFCGSNLTTDTQMNEIGCSLMDGAATNLDLIVAPVMSNTSGTGGKYARGGGDGNYGLFPKGNIDVTGKYFIWTSNHHSSRLDAFLVKVPSQLLLPDPTGTFSQVTHRWQLLRTPATNHGPLGSTVPVVVGGAVALITQMDCTGADCDSTSTRLYYSKNGGTFVQVPDACAADGVCFYGTPDADVLSGTVTCCLSGDLTQNNGPTNTTSAVSVIDIAQDGSFVRRSILKFGASVVSGDAFCFKEYHQTDIGNALDAYTPSGGACVNIVPMSLGGGV
jgi:hypothetical protein